MDPSITQMRKRIETNWINTLRKAYSYDGLNDQVGNDYRKAKTKLVTFCHYQRPILVVEG